MNYFIKYFNNFFYFKGIIFVVLAGLLWSFGPLVVRYMDNGYSYTFQYLFFRGISIAIILIFYLFIKEGKKFYKNFYRVGISGIFGGIFLSIAFIGFIFSINMTTAAVTLFMLATMPFIAAIVGYFVLNEKLRKITLIAMIISLFGVLIMIYDDSIGGSIIGALLGFLSAVGFALYTVSIRFNPDIPKFTTVVLAGIFCALFSLFMLGFSFESFYKMPTINSYLSLLHGTIVASGLICYSLGAKYLPSAELALLSLMEVVGGVIWVWIPVFGINEVPSFTVIFGGLIIIFSVAIFAVGSRKKREPVTL